MGQGLLVERGVTLVVWVVARVMMDPVGHVLPLSAWDEQLRSLPKRQASTGGWP